MQQLAMFDLDRPAETAMIPADVLTAAMLAGDTEPTLPAIDTRYRFDVGDLVDADLSYLHAGELVEQHATGRVYRRRILPGARPEYLVDGARHAHWITERKLAAAGE